MCKISLETNRTKLRPLTVDYAEDFYKLNLDQEVLKFTGDHPFDTIESTRMFILTYDQYKKFSVGRLAVIEKKTKKFRWCGLKYNSETNEYDWIQVL